MISIQTRESPDCVSSGDDTVEHHNQQVVLNQLRANINSNYTRKISCVSPDSDPEEACVQPEKKTNVINPSDDSLQNYNSKNKDVWK